MEEIWKPIEGFETLYEVSNTGKVRRCAGWIKNGKTTKRYAESLIIALDVNKQRHNYIYCHLYKNNKICTRQIHRLVAAAFIPNTNALPEVNHIDGNKNNNCVNNLEWCTDKENKQHAWANGLCNSDHRKQKIKCIQTGEIFESVITCAKQMGLHRENIFNHMRGGQSHVKGYTYERV
jgi:hypothetical protein